MPLELHGPKHRFGRQLPAKKARSPYSTDTNALSPGWGEVWLALVRRWALWLVLLEILLMLSSTVRRSLLSLLAVSTVGTLGFSAAATLDVTSDQFAAGDADTGGSCADTAVDVTWEIGWGGTTAGYEITDVTLIGPASFQTDCEGWDLRLDFMDTNGTILATNGTFEDDNVVISGTTYTVDLSAQLPSAVIPAADVYHVGVVLTDDGV